MGPSQGLAFPGTAVTRARYPSEPLSNRLNRESWCRGQGPQRGDILLESGVAPKSRPGSWTVSTPALGVDKGWLGTRPQGPRENRRGVSGAVIGRLQNRRFGGESGLVLTTKRPPLHFIL